MKNSLTNDAIDIVKRMISLYKMCKKESNVPEFTFWLRESIYNILSEIPKKYHPSNVPLECQTEGLQMDDN